MEQFDHSSNKQSAEYEQTVRNLFESMSQPFENSDSPIGYQLRLEYLPPKNVDLLAVSAAQRLVHTLTECYIDPLKPWSIQVGYDPKCDSLGANEILIPLRSDIDDDILRLTRVHSPAIDYYATRERCGQLLSYLSGAQQMEELVHGKPATVSLENVQDLLSAVRYNFTETNSKIAFQYMTAEALQHSPVWTRREEIVSPIHPDFQAHLIREVHVSDDHLEHQSPFDGELTFHFRRFDDEQCVQKTVHLPCEGYFFSEPCIRQDVFQPHTSPNILREHVEEYALKNSLTIKATPATIDSFAQAINYSFKDMI